MSTGPQAKIPPARAYCAPGRAAVTRQILERTDPDAVVVEHPYMAGRSDIVLVSPWTPFPPGQANMTGERASALAALFWRHEFRWPLITPDPLVVSAVTQ